MRVVWPLIPVALAASTTTELVITGTTFSDSGLIAVWVTSDGGRSQATVREATRAQLKVSVPSGALEGPHQIDVHWLGSGYTCLDVQPVASQAAPAAASTRCEFPEYRFEHDAYQSWSEWPERERCGLDEEHRWPEVGGALGFADERDTLVYNAWLSWMRAQGVASALKESGAVALPLEIVALSESGPRDLGKGPASMARNRRVELTLSPTSLGCDAIRLSSLDGELPLTSAALDGLRCWQRAGVDSAVVAASTTQVVWRRAGPRGYEQLLGDQQVATLWREASRRASRLATWLRAQGMDALEAVHLIPEAQADHVGMITVFPMHVTPRSEKEGALVYRVDTTRCGYAPTAPYPAPVGDARRRPESATGEAPTNAGRED
ncbi:MAG: hypothetical protein H6739_11925 [Alphaproteobacteria bacterium]|nr:hypothetical protein [Alphaproteobacteria bacterium]